MSTHIFYVGGNPMVAQLYCEFLMPSIDPDQQQTWYRICRHAGGITADCTSSWIGVGMGPEGYHSLSWNPHMAVDMAEWSRWFPRQEQLVLHTVDPVWGIHYAGFRISWVRQGLRARAWAGANRWTMPTRPVWLLRLNNQVITEENYPGRDRFLKDALFAVPDQVGVFQGAAFRFERIIADMQLHVADVSAPAGGPQLGRVMQPLPLP